MMVDESTLKATRHVRDTILGSEQQFEIWRMKMIQMALEAKGWDSHGLTIREKLQNRRYYSEAVEKARDYHFPVCEKTNGRECPRCPECTRWKGVEWPTEDWREYGVAPIVYTAAQIRVEVNTGQMRDASQLAREDYVWDRLTETPPPDYNTACSTAAAKPCKCSRSAKNHGILNLLRRLWTR
jgi:hypothetical protein